MCFVDGPNRISVHRRAWSFLARESGGRFSALLITGSVPGPGSRRSFKRGSDFRKETIAHEREGEAFVDKKQSGPVQHPVGVESKRYEGMDVKRIRQGRETEVFPSTFPEKEGEDLIHGFCQTLLFLAEAMVSLTRTLEGERHVFVRTDKRLGQNQIMVRKMLDLSPYGIYLLDLETLRVIDSNQIFCRMLGYPSREMVIGGDLSTILNVGADETRAIVDSIRGAEGKPGELFRSYRKRDGALLKTKERGTSVPFAGRTVGMVYLEDITEEVETHELDLLKSELDMKILEGASFEPLLQAIAERISSIYGALWVDISTEEDGGLTSAVVTGLNSQLKEDIWNAEGAIRGSEQTKSGQAFRSGTHQSLRLRETPESYLYKKLYERYGVQEVHVFPLRKGHQIFGVFRMAFDRENALEPLSVSRIERATTWLAVLFERASEQEQLRLQTTALATVANGILIADTAGTILWVNASLCQISGYARDELVGKRTNIFHSGKQTKAFFRRLWKTLRNGNSFEGQIVNRRKDGTLYTVETTITPILSWNGAITHFVGVQKDITARIEKEEEIWALANRDPLTGLLNRLSLHDRLRSEIDLVVRSGTSCALLFLDLDGFKSVNDTLGHAMGDRLIQTIGARLSETSRATDLIARLGGDEFIVVLTDASDVMGDIQGVVRRLLSSISAPVIIEENTLRVTASVGIVRAPMDATKPEDLLKKADIAMVHAKDLGKNTWCFFDPEMEREIRAEYEWGNALRAGIDNLEFRIYYQPQMDVVSQQVVGVEALLRWEKPGEGLIAPGRFIPLAEKTGIIFPLGKWVLKEVFGTIRRWHESGRPRIHVSVNISARQFKETSFWECLYDLLEVNGELSRWLTLELTESVLMEDHGEVAVRIAKIRERGVRVSLDDFGTGYSSLSYLSRIPFDEIKVPQEFVMRMGASSKDQLLVQSIIQVGKGLGFDLVGEGAETGEDIAKLLEFGCPVIQGYALSRPLPLLELESFLDRVAGNPRITEKAE